jgi:hypothetical protein
MMELAYTSIYFPLIAVALQVVVLRICSRNPAMWQRRNWFRFAAVLWCAMPIAKVLYIDEILPPTDGIEHELIAREVAELVLNGRFAEAASYFEIGNNAYRFFLGLFYAVTGASEFVTYTLNGALGFCGLMMLLDVLCRHSRCHRLPASITLMTGLLPSAILWTTANLKEGATLWGICAMYYFTLSGRSHAGRTPRALPVIGFLTIAILRPHIAAIWLVAVSAGAMIQAKRFGTFAASIAAGGVLLAMLNAYAPTVMEDAMGAGVSTTLADRYSTLSSNDNLNGVALTGNNPLPIISGLTLILFRPWPFEATNVTELLVGFEVWVLAVLGFLCWKRAHVSWRVLMHPAVATQITALLALGFFFSYMYNMGLVVRQRLMCFPAVLFLYFYPLLAKQSAWRNAVHNRRMLNRSPSSASARRQSQPTR